jgi:hypothetical protein
MATKTDTGASHRARFATHRAPSHANEAGHAREVSALGDGAVLERLTRMRKACHALAIELAQSRRRLRAAEAELARLRQRQR